MSAVPAITDAQQAAIERGLVTAANIAIYRVRLRAVMDAVCDVGGFPALVKMTQGELRSIQALLIEAGGDTGGWVV